MDRAAINTTGNIEEQAPLPLSGSITAVSPSPSPKLELKTGELVEIRSAEQILATLDSQGKLDGLSFMPEMHRYCGRRFRVARRADSTCVAGRPRRMENAVHLEALRCDGSAHYGCGAACLLLWKESWLQRVSDTGENGQAKGVPPHRAPGASASALNGSAHPSSNGHVAKGDESPGMPEPRVKPAYPNGALVCQVTDLNSATCPLNLGNPALYVAGVLRDYRSGRVGSENLRVVLRYLRGKLLLAAFMTWARAPWNADRYRKTPAERLDLRIGEWVEVRSARDILRTLDRNGCNRGMEFKAEMFQFCGRRFPVLARMERRIDERTGLMREFKNECILLAGVHCQGQRSFCARSNYHYWREIWLRRC